jgi:VanZ family protein
MKKNRYFVGAVIYFAFLSVLSHIPGSALHTMEWEFWDKAAHFYAYLPLGYLLALGLTYRGVGGGRWGILLLAAGMVFLLGIADEFHQSFVPGRDAAVPDVIADVIGGFVGAVVGLIVGLAVLRKNRLAEEKETTRSRF